MVCAYEMVLCARFQAYFHASKPITQICLPLDCSCPTVHHLPTASSIISCIRHSSSSPRCRRRSDQPLWRRSSRTSAGRRKSRMAFICVTGVRSFMRTSPRACWALCAAAWGICHLSHLVICLCVSPGCEGHLY